MAEQFNGTVRVKDGNKAPADYGVNREVEVSISFFTDEPDKLPGMAQQAADVADGIVNTKLGRTAGPPVTIEVAPVANKPGRKPKDKPPTPAANDNDPSGMTVIAVPKGETKAAADPAAMGGEASGQAISTGGERADPGAVDASLFTSEAPVITDNDLMATITRKNAETKNAPAIRAMIGRYVPQDGKPHQAAEIAQDKRAAFKLELDTVAKLAA